MINGQRIVKGLRDDIQMYRDFMYPTMDVDNGHGGKESVVGTNYGLKI